MVEKGFFILKLKVGVRENPMDDAEVARRVRKVVGDAIHLRADANQGWDLPTALKVMRAMEESNLEFIEQPTRGEWLHEVRQATTCYVMADESANSPEDVLNLAKRNAVDLISVYINNGGGITAAKKMATVAEPARIMCYIGGALEGPIAARACLHFGASTPNVTFGCEQSGQFLLKEDLGKEPIQFENGYFLVPHGPGLGGELDEEKAKAYQVGHVEIRPE
jgi:muconate cycloisomerase